MLFFNQCFLIADFGNIFGNEVLFLIGELFFLKTDGFVVVVAVFPRWCNDPKKVCGRTNFFASGRLRKHVTSSQAQLVRGPVGQRPRQSTHTHTNSCTGALLLSWPVTKWACDQLGRAYTHTHTNTCTGALLLSWPVTKWTCDQLGL